MSGPENKGEGVSALPPQAKEPDPVKRSDQIKLLETCAHFTDAGEWNGVFTYPNCGWHLVQLGLVTQDKKITPAGRFALWVLGRGEDPMPDEKSFVSISIPLPGAEK